MLIVARQLQELDFHKLMALYKESNLWNAAEFFPRTPSSMALELVEQRLWNYLSEEFYKTPGSFYCVLAEEDEYLSALRLEPYRDGMLMEALETMQKYRNLGFASKLIERVKEVYPGILYSHVEKRNRASLRVHEKCGFQKILDYAAYIDGSVAQNAYTLQLHRKK